MTVKELIKNLERMDEDSEVKIGVQGYVSNGEVAAYETDNSVYVVDGCFYEEIDG